ncbi:histone-lysine N-methyltransferase SETMAR [Trichonephila clavipes]|nr:histone-lysine N-methyltransferase SETMAR [Trichonephila clavipes]
MCVLGLSQIVLAIDRSINIDLMPIPALRFFFDKDENARQVAEIMNGVYGANTVTANYVQFWIRRFRSGIFDVKDARRTGRPVIENVDKITEIIEVDRIVSSRSIVQGLQIDHKPV